MLKKLLSALTGAVLFLSMPIVSLAVERYEVLQVGDEDAWVMELQEKLNEMGYLKVPATGYYGTNTQNAVVRYQRDHGLSADGKAGPATRASILGDDYREITGPREHGVDQSIISRPTGSSTSSGDIESSTQVVKPNPEKPVEVKPEATQKPANDEDTGDALRLGDSGDAVTALQERLREYEYYDYGSITGYFGPVTEEAVRKFQRTYGLTEDGIVGAKAQAILNSSGLRYYMMRPGDNGEDVRKMQARLAELGYLDSSATGYFGNVTKQALMAFQDRHGLTADGTAGKDTRALLYSDDALEAPTNGGDDPATEPSDDPSEEPGSDGPSSQEPNGYDPSKEPGDSSDDPSEEPGDSSDDPSEEPGDSGDDPSEEPGDNNDDPSEEPGDSGDDPSEEPGDDPSDDPDDNNGDDPSDDPDDNNGDDPSDDPDDNNGDDPSDDPDDNNGDDPSDDPDDNNDNNDDDPSDDPDDGDGTASGSVDRLLEVAESQTGKPYVYGSSGPNSFDCSGFVYYALKGAGVSCSRQSAAGFAGTSSWETIKSKDNLRVGDLVFFKSDSGSAISHVGIYLGDGNFIHSAPSIDGVGYSTMSSGYYSRNFVTAKRVF